MSLELTDTFRMFLSCCKTRYSGRPKLNSYKEIFPIIIDDRSGGLIRLFPMIDVKSQPIVNITLKNVEPIKVAAINSNVTPTDVLVLTMCMMTV